MENYKPITNESFPFTINNDSIYAAQEILSENTLNVHNIIDTVAALPLTDEELAYASFALASQNSESTIMGVVAKYINGEDLYELMSMIARHESFANICTMLLSMAEDRKTIVLYFMFLGQLTHKDAQLFELFAKLRLIAGLSEIHDQLVKKLDP